MLTIGLIDAIASEEPKIATTIQSTTSSAFDELELATVLPERLQLCVRDLRRDLDTRKDVMSDEEWNRWEPHVWLDSHVWLGELQVAINATSEQTWLEIAEVLLKRFWEQREVLRKIHEIPGLIVKQRYTETRWVWQYQCTASDEDFQTEDWDGMFDTPIDALTHFIKAILDKYDRL